MRKTILMSSLIAGQLYATQACSTEVLVIGSGPAGLAVVRALDSQGVKAEVIEREDGVHFDGSGIAIPANGAWALEKLGIDISAKAKHISHMQFTDEQGELLVQEELVGIHHDKAQFYSLTRTDLMKLMLASLAPDRAINHGLTINNFTEANEKVRIEFSDGRVKEYDFVIACDGIHSNTRKKIHKDEVKEFLNLAVWRTLVKAPEALKIPTYMMGADRLFMLYPMPDGQAYVYGHIYQSEKQPPLESFLSAFENFKGLVPEVLETIRLENPKVHFHHMEKSHSLRFKLEGFSRILLLGDAAHGFGPMLQNGAASAFEDAYVLQELIKSGITPGTIPSLINAFEERRRQRVQQIFDMSNMRIKAISDPRLVSERNKAIRENGAPNVNGFKVVMRNNP
jgi:2-polyprenyl-6-methoxyphenol hydroxylase-like FAD-dependent oxidoreductase